MRKQGFTLIELVVAIGIFSIITIMMIGLFGTFVRKQRHDIAEQQLLENVRFALEFFNREVRTAYGDTYALTSSNGSSIMFRNQNLHCVMYRLKDQKLERAEVTSSRDTCEESDFNNASFGGVTDSSVKINYLRFDAFPSETNGNSLISQGFVTTIMKAQASDPSIEPLELQSTITSRQITPYHL